MKELIKPVIRMGAIPEIVQTAVDHARSEFVHRQEIVRLAALLAYVEDRSEIRTIETNLLRETSHMITDMAIKEGAVSDMSSTELSLYKSML